MSDKDQAIILVCMRLADGPRIVDAVGACGTCGEEVGMSAESRKVYNEHQGKHEIRCGICQIRLHGVPSAKEINEIISRMTPGQLAELYKVYQEEQQSHESN